MHILTWNLWHDDSFFSERVEKVAGIITGLDVDVVLLQENRAWQNGSAARAIAEATGHHLTEGCFRPIPEGGSSGLAVLTRTAPSAWVEVPLSSRGSGAALAVQVETELGLSYFASVHLTEGPTMEHIREDETYALEQHAASANAKYSAVGGTFATYPDSDAVRYLTGRVSRNDSGAYWIDSWEYVGEGKGFTIASHNDFTEMSREERGFDRPDLVPPRREDIVLVRGYIYGEPGSPFNANLVGTGSANASDHYGVSVHTL